MWEQLSAGLKAPFTSQRSEECSLVFMVSVNHRRGMEQNPWVLGHTCTVQNWYSLIHCFVSSMQAYVLTSGSMETSCFISADVSFENRYRKFTMAHNICYVYWALSRNCFMWIIYFMSRNSKMVLGKQDNLLLLLCSLSPGLSRTTSGTVMDPQELAGKRWVPLYGPYPSVPSSTPWDISRSKITS